ncbi:MAG: hypothetical protein GY761_00015, partial [Hyphomicrobiales bacterium]|nr:hypothetical protein [Hyphomicrobiales bacterium]
DGIETVSQSQSGVHFDMDGDYFREQTGWVSSDDGFLARDINGNGVFPAWQSKQAKLVQARERAFRRMPEQGLINDDITEMFGAPANDNGCKMRRVA